MSKRKKIVLICIVFLLVVGVAILLVCLNNKKSDDSKVTVKVDGWELEYVTTDRTIEDFQEIELGSTYREVCNKVGESDTHIGSGIIQPVWFLEDKKAAVLWFWGEGVEKIEVYNKNGKCTVLKENTEE